MALAMAATMSAVPAFAAETEQTAEKTTNQVWNVDNNLNEASSKMMLEVVKAKDTLIATVPLELPIVVDTKGNVTVPTEAKIINNCEDKAIQVKKITFVTPDDGLKLLNSNWKDNGLTEFNAPAVCLEINKLGVNTLNEGQVINSNTSRYSTNKMSMNLENNTNFKIAKNDSLPLNIEAFFSKVTYQNAAKSEQFATATFTIGFAE